MRSVSNMSFITFLTLKLLAAGVVRVNSLVRGLLRKYSLDTFLYLFQPFFFFYAYNKCYVSHHRCDLRRLTSLFCWSVSSSNVEKVLRPAAVSTVSATARLQATFQRLTNIGQRLLLHFFISIQQFFCIFFFFTFVLAVFIAVR